MSQSPEGLAGSVEASVWLVFVARGAGIVHAPEVRWPLLRGTACQSAQRVEVTGPVLRGWTLSLGRRSHTDLEEHNAASLDVRTLPAGVAMRCEGFFEALEAELDRGANQVNARAIQALVDLILLCYERSPHPGDAGNPAVETLTRAHQLVDEIMAVIDGHYAERLSLADIAGMVNRSSSSLARAARTVTGRSVVELIAERRIKEARALLIATSLPIAEVAAQVGYPNNARFHRAFRRSTSLTPREWRAEASRTLAASLE